MNSISIGNKINVLIESHDLNEYNERMEDLMWSDEIVNKIPTEQCTVFQVYFMMNSNSSLIIFISQPLSRVRN
jgi:hypothetical protein